MAQTTSPPAGGGHRLHRQGQPWSRTQPCRLRSLAVEHWAKRGRKVLIVDDNQIVLKAFEKLKLKACGFEVSTTAEGTTAVSIARQQQPDLIVLDINFPPDVGSSGLAWDGFSIMQWMRRFQEVSKIPVIIISSNDALKFKDKAIAAGATAFFQKPISYDEFLLAAHRAMTQNANAAEPAKAS